jgi:hypothetical protein
MFKQAMGEQGLSQSSDADVSFFPADLKSSRMGTRGTSLPSQGPLECVSPAASLSTAWPMPLLRWPWGAMQLLAIKARL